jgi:hypothetical protein
MERGTREQMRNKCPEKEGADVETWREDPGCPSTGKCAGRQAWRGVRAFCGIEVLVRRGAVLEEKQADEGEELV